MLEKNSTSTTTSILGPTSLLSTLGSPMCPRSSCSSWKAFHSFKPFIIEERRFPQQFKISLTSTFHLERSTMAPKTIKLSLLQKIKIIEASKKNDFNNESRKELCEEFGIDSARLTQILDQQIFILHSYHHSTVNEGQKISKAFFFAFNSSKKLTRKFLSSAIVVK